jgi:hypothetical protein
MGLAVRLAVPGDLQALSDIDLRAYGTPDDDFQLVVAAAHSWTEEGLRSHVRNLGVLKVACEGPWPVGWIAYRRQKDLLIVERVVAEPLAEAPHEITAKLLAHVEKWKRDCTKLDVIIPFESTCLPTIKSATHSGFHADLIVDYYGKGSDGIALYKSFCG